MTGPLLPLLTAPMFEPLVAFVPPPPGGAALREYLTLIHHVERVLGQQSDS